MGRKGLSNEEELKGTWPEDREEALRLYADRLAQQYIANGYHGFDIDYEPGAGGIDASGCPKGEDFLHFVDQLGKYFGPKSGTDRLLMIDGELALRCRNAHLISTMPLLKPMAATV